MGFVENDMTVSNHPARLEVETGVTVMTCRVAKQGAWRGASTKLVRHRGYLIGVTQTPEHSQMIVGRG